MTNGFDLAIRHSGIRHSLVSAFARQQEHPTKQRGEEFGAALNPAVAIGFGKVRALAQQG
jgi:hypothetical protein